MLLTSSSGCVSAMIGLYGSNVHTDAMIDMIIDGLADLRPKVYAMESAPAEKQARV